MGDQGRLFRLTIRRVEPAEFGSADCKAMGVGDDGLLYIIKRTSDAHPLVPVSEYICTKLALMVKLPVAPCFIAELPDGDLAFASREEGGVLDYFAALQLLCTPAVLARHIPTLSRFFAYDVFVQNVDRHPGNFLLRQSRLGEVLLGIDFSRALLVEGWPSRRPPLPLCNTVHTKRRLEQIEPFLSAEAVALVERLGALDDDWLRHTLCEVPDVWLDATVRRQLTKWWRTSRLKRIRLLRRHFDSGRYLRICADPRRA